MNVDLLTVRQRLITRLAANPKVTGLITGTTVITDDLGLDSLSVMNFVMEIEDEMDVSVPLDRLANVRTVDDLARCLVELSGAR